jgi:hypothetical protein
VASRAAQNDSGNFVANFWDMALEDEEQLHSFVILKTQNPAELFSCEPEICGATCRAGSDSPRFDPLKRSFCLELLILA